MVGAKLQNTAFEFFELDLGKSEMVAIAITHSITH